MLSSRSSVLVSEPAATLTSIEEVVVCLFLALG
jgi:hypothetical protein